MEVEMEERETELHQNAYNCLEIFSLGMRQWLCISLCSPKGKQKNLLGRNSVMSPTLFQSKEIILKMHAADLWDNRPTTFKSLSFQQYTTTEVRAKHDTGNYLLSTFPFFTLGSNLWTLTLSLCKIIQH